MRFIHIADVHLGAAPEAGTAYAKSRPQELWDTFSRMITRCEEEQQDLLLIAGDLFHRQPLLRELKEVNYLFSTLTHTKVVLIAGNHDYIRQDSHYRTFSWNKNVFPLFGEALEAVVFKEYNTAVYGFSYYGKELREPRLERVSAPGALAHEILLVHGGDEKHLPIRRETLQKSGFDYVALGHIHKPLNVIKDQAVFAGALEPTDKNDVGPHGFVQGELQDGRVHTEFIPFAKREYLHLRLQVEESMTGGSVRALIQKTIEERGIEHIYKFILCGFKDPDIIFDTEHMDIYGNILEIEDQTRPAFDFEELCREHKDNVIGKYIQMFAGCEDGSVESEALYEGVQALLSNRV